MEGGGILYCAYDTVATSPIQFKCCQHSGSHATACLPWHHAHAELHFTERVALPSHACTSAEVLRVQEFDGASRKNPGPAGAGAVLFTEGGEQVEPDIQMLEIVGVFKQTPKYYDIQGSSQWDR